MGCRNYEFVPWSHTWGNCRYKQIYLKVTIFVTTVRICNKTSIWKNFANWKITLYSGMSFGMQNIFKQYYCKGRDRLLYEGTHKKLNLKYINISAKKELLKLKVWVDSWIQMVLLQIHSIKVYRFSSNLLIEQAANIWVKCQRPSFASWVTQRVSNANTWNFKLNCSSESREHSGNRPFVFTEVFKHRSTNN